jgi:selenocysteine-specific elongation factor
MLQLWRELEHYERFKQEDRPLELLHLKIRTLIRDMNAALAEDPENQELRERRRQLQEELAALISARDVADLHRPRLWVDRSFTAAGSGTIVTGSLLEGPLEIDETVRIYPTGGMARIRGIQSHEQALDRVGPGRRVALNLAGIDRDEVGRGDMVGLPGEWLTASRFVGSIRYARYVEEFDKRGAFQLHIGSKATALRIVGLEDGLAVFQTDDPVPVAVGDRFVIRDTGRKLVTAGGRVLDPAPGSTTTALVSARVIDPSATADEIATRLLELRGVDLQSAIASQSKGGTPGNARTIGEKVFTMGMFDGWRSQALDLVAAEHQSHPLRVGLPLATLAERLRVDRETAEMIATEEEGLERIGPDVALTGRIVEMNEEARTTWEQAKRRLETGLAVPTVEELGIDPELLHLQIRLGDLVRVGENLVFLPDQIEELKTILRGMPDAFTVANFRDATGLSRKYAVPVLEWADMEGLTVRRGDTRSVR